MGNKPLVEVVYDDIGEHGLPSKATAYRGELADTDRVLDTLRQKGCGAWKGREQCAAPLGKKSAAVLGETKLFFSTYVSAGPMQDLGNMWVVLVCTDHEDVNLVKDMPRSLRRSQERERQKFLKLREVLDG
jgi:hypothetical protein